MAGQAMQLVDHGQRHLSVKPLARDLREGSQVQAPCQHRMQSGFLGQGAMKWIRGEERFQQFLL